MKLETVGAILMVVGILGLVIALIYPLLLTRRPHDPEIEPPTRRY